MPPTDGEPDEYAVLQRPLDGSPDGPVDVALDPAAEGVVQVSRREWTGAAGEIVSAARAAPLDVGRRGRNAALQLLARTLLVRGITVVGTIALARILRPAEFGIFAVVTFSVTVLSLLGDFGVGAALVQQRHEPTETELGTAWVTQQAIWGSVVVLIWLLAPLVTVLSPALPADAPWLVRVMSLSLIFTSLRALPQIMMSRVLRFGPLAATEVVTQLVYYGVTVALAWLGFGVWSFVIAAVTQAALGCVMINVAWGRWAGARFDRRVVRRLLGFGAAFQVSSVITSLRDGVVPVFGGLAGGVTGIGFLQFSFRTGQLISTVDDVIARIAFPAFSRLQGQPERMGRLVVNGVEATALGLAMTQCFTIAVAPTLVPVVFSHRWEPAVLALQLVSLGTLGFVPTRFLRALTFAGGNSRDGLRLTALTVGLLWLSFPLLVLTLGLVGGGLAFALAGFAGLLMYAHATAEQVRFPWLALGRIYAIGAVGGAAAAIVVSALGGLIGLVASGLVFLLVYFGLLVIFERERLLRAYRIVRGRAAVDAA